MPEGATASCLSTLPQPLHNLSATERRRVRAIWQMFATRIQLSTTALSAGRLESFWTNICDMCHIANICPA